MHRKKTKTDELVRKDKRYLWHPFTQMRDWEREDVLVIEKGRGNYLIDTNGKKYLDGVSSLWCNVFGHRKPELDKALEKQAGKIAHSTFLGLTNPPAIKLAEKLIEITPKNLTRVFYSDSGSEAVEIALKMAFQYWQQKGETKRKEFVTLGDAYHGDTIGSVSLGGIGLFHAKYKALLFKTYKIKAPSWFMRGGNLSEKEFLKQVVQEVETLIRKKHKKICAFVMEPLMQGAAGMLKHPAGFLGAVRRITKKYGILLILDEVATGFGRTGRMFASEHENVKPDIMCLAKGLTGGYLPLAATITSEAIYEGFLGSHSELKTFFHGHTYTGNPLASAVALENLRIFKREKIIQKSQSKIKQLASGLRKFRCLNHVADIRQSGFMIGIELLKDVKKRTPYSLKEKIGIRVVENAREKGVILRPLGNVIVLMPPLSITESEINKLLNVTYKAIQKVTNSG